MPVEITYPSNVMLKLIERDLLPVLTADDPIFKLFPMVSEDTSLLQWEVMDNYSGLQAVRGLNGQPGRVTNLGGKKYECKPGYYGEFAEITEAEITEKRVLGTFGDPISLDKEIIEKQRFLLNRRLLRIKKILWTLLTTGTFSVAKENGQILHTDTFTLTTITPATPWSTLATSTPLKDIRLGKVTAQTGHSVVFDKTAQMYMNENSVNNLLNNTKASDIGGKRLAAGATFNSLADYNKVLMDQDLPEIVPWHDGYYDDDKVFQLFIPNGKAVLIGRRLDNMTVGDYAMTRNAQNEGLAPGPYTIVTDSLNKGSNPVPRTVRVDDGHNGGPRIYYPSAIAVFNI